MLYIIRIVRFKNYPYGWEFAEDEELTYARRGRLAEHSIINNQEVCTGEYIYLSKDQIWKKL